MRWRCPGDAAQLPLVLAHGVTWHACPCTYRYVIGLAYRGTGNNGAIQKLLHYAVTDVSNDVSGGPSRGRRHCWWPAPRCSLVAALQLCILHATRSQCRPHPF